MRATTPRTPISDVRDAIAAGALSRGDIAHRTGLSPSTVDAVIDFLEHTGRLRRERLASSCDGGACASCSLSHRTPDGEPSCGMHEGPERGPVALVLNPRRRDRFPL